MPWKETRAVDKRLEFITELGKDPRCNFAQLCRRFGISRNNGYKWVARYNAGGLSGLEDAKSVPRTCPHKTPDAVVDRVLALRKERPYDGPKKLYAILSEREPKLVVPAPSTIGEILKRHGQVRPRRARLRVPPSASPLSHAQQPNDVWCVDFKGNFVMGDGSRCYPLTITDATTRYLVKCEGLVAQTDALTRRQFELAFREFGLPLRIRSDNGTPFAAKALGGLSALSIWWIQLGIEPERIEPGQPQQNGRHERFHLTLKQQTASPPEATAADQQRAFDRFRHDYNDVRPHEALGQTPPARHYEPSLRVMPDKPRCPEYGADFAVRWVNSTNGMISWEGVTLKLTRLLGGQPVGLKRIDEDEWELFYGPVLLGYVLNEKGAMKIEPIS
jgi:transposase InsO family protein